MRKPRAESAGNVTPLSGKPFDRDPFIANAAEALAGAGSADDPRMKEALRLMRAFLAIEDAGGRAALVTLAERLVSYHWMRSPPSR